jgi:hypothetical protein
MYRGWRHVTRLRGAGGCACDGGHLRRDGCLLTQSLIRRLAVEGAVGPVEVVVVLPLAELVVEKLRVVDDLALEQPVELLLVDAVRAFNLAIEPGGM